MLKLLRLPTWLRTQRAARTLAYCSLIAADIGIAQAQVPTAIDLLVNHQAGMVFYGLEGDGSQVNGPAGAEYFYQARVRINGPSGLSINQVTLTQVLPEAAIFKGIDAPPGTSCATTLVDGAPINASNQQVLCVIANVTSDAFVDVNFRIILPTVHAGWRALASVAAANNTDPEEGNSSELARSISTYDATDLSLVFSSPAMGAVVIEGVAFDYQLRVTNQAAPYGKNLLAGEQAIVRFEQPDGTQFTNTPSGNGWQCRILVAEPSIWECGYTVTNTVPINTDLPLLSFPAVTQNLGAVTATANVSSTNANQQAVRDVNPGDNTASLTIHSEADTFTNVTLSKTAHPVILDQQGGEQALTYTITARWASGSASPGTLSVSDPLPTGVSIDVNAVVEANRGAAWDCAASTAVQLHCTFSEDSGNYPSRGHAFPALRVPALVASSRLESGLPIFNTATVTATNEHPERTSDNSASATAAISNRVNLQVSKRPIAAGGTNLRVVRNGDVFAYQISIFNQGPVALLGGQTIRLEDPLHQNLRFVAVTDSNANASPSSTQWTCSEVNATVNCRFTVNDTVPAGETIELFFWVEVVDIPENGHASLSNSVAITDIEGREHGPNPIIGIAPLVNASDKAADLAISKTAAVAPNARSGDLVTYTLTVSNLGNQSNQAAKTVQLEDTITNLITAAYAQAPFLIAPIPRDENAAQGLYWYNDYLTLAVEGTSNAQDSCTLNGYTSNQTSANLACTFHDMPVNARYTVTVQAKQFVDPYTGANPHEPTQITANGIDGVLGNTATVYSPDTNDSNLDNNSATAYVVMQALTDLVVTRQASPLNADGNAQAAAGGAITYVVAVENTGPSAATNVVLADTLPLGAYWIGLPPAASNNGQCGFRTAQAADLQSYRDGDRIDADNQILLCQWPGNFAKGQQTLSYQLRSEQQGQDQLLSTAEVRTTTPEADNSNNRADQTVILSAPQVDVLIAMRHTADGIALGQSTTYTITVANNVASDSYARDVVMNNQFHSPLIRDGRPPIPSSAVFRFGQITALDSHGRDVGAAPFTSDNCVVDATEATGSLRCHFPWLAPGESVDVSFTMVAQSIPNGRVVGTIFHLATVSAALEAHPDFNVLDNNTTQDRTSTYDPTLVGQDIVGPPVLADLELHKSVRDIAHADPDAAQDAPVTAGSTIAYQLVVRNLETEATQVASDILVTDVLPAGVSVLETSLPSNCSYAAASRVLSCALDSLEAGQEYLLNFSVLVDTPYNETGPDLLNCAAVSSDYDPVDANNSDCVALPSRPSVQPPEPAPPAPIPVPSLNLLALALLGLCMVCVASRARRRGQ